MGAATLIIILTTFLFSYRGFKDHYFFDKYSFEVEKILLYKQYRRLFTSGFLHINWLHLIFNMLSLYFFSQGIETYLGELRYLVIYLASLIGGNLLALFIHRNHGDYSAVGASGAVNGVIFAAIALFPGMRIGFFFLPIGIPAWLFGLLFVAFSIYGIRSRRENVGHEVHLGGALVGMLIALLMVPEAIVQNYIPILIIVIPVLVFLYVIVYKPQLLLVNNLYYNNHNYTIDHRYNMEKVEQQSEIDKILEKIHKKGIKSLTKKERQRLEEYSKISK
jgi:membrane associated rhomboid family serine protease